MVPNTNTNTNTNTRNNTTTTSLFFSTSLLLLHPNGLDLRVTVVPFACRPATRKISTAPPASTSPT